MWPLVLIKKSRMPNRHGIASGRALSSRKFLTRRDIVSSEFKTGSPLRFSSSILSTTACRSWDSNLGRILFIGNQQLYGPGITDCCEEGIVHADGRGSEDHSDLGISRNCCLSQVGVGARELCHLANCRRLGSTSR